jgi:hypothetical protein
LQLEGPNVGAISGIGNSGVVESSHAAPLVIGERAAQSSRGPFVDRRAVGLKRDGLCRPAVILQTGWVEFGVER